MALSTNSVATDQVRSCTQGYVNWNSKHEILKTKLWKSVEEISVYLHEVETGRIVNFNFFLENTKTVDVRTRFPKDNLYVDVNNPLVRAEMLYVKQMSRGMTRLPGILERFMDAFKNQMQTYSSFEKEYGLRWVEVQEDPDKNIACENGLPRHTSFQFEKVIRPH